METIAISTLLGMCWAVFWLTQTVFKTNSVEEAAKEMKSFKFLFGGILGLFIIGISTALLTS